MSKRCPKQKAVKVVTGLAARWHCCLAKNKVQLQIAHIFNEIVI